MTAVVDRVAGLLHEQFPLVFCSRCTAGELGLPEQHVREAAQVLLSTRPGYRLARRMCRGCFVEGELLEAPAES